MHRVYILTAVRGPYPVTLEILSVRLLSSGDLA